MDMNLQRIYSFLSYGIHSTTDLAGQQLHGVRVLRLATAR